jgi:parallel beta-helix repeat protein
LQELENSQLGDRIIVPIEELRQPLTTQRLRGAPVATVTYAPDENTIYLAGAGRVIDIPTIAAKLSQPLLLEQTAPGEWIVRAHIIVGEGATLVIAGDAVTWLKLKSEDTHFSWLWAQDANILIENSKVTSWNESTNTFDLTYNEDGRSYLLAKVNGRMDVINSEIAYLGYGIDEGFGAIDPHAGGVYGLSWRLSDGSLGKYMVTGVVRNSKIHHNYYGLYTYGVTGMLMEHNEVYANVQYGFDPHDGSNNLLIANNIARNNGNHGIITSKRCYNNIIRNNLSYNNRLHGIMLDRQSNNNLVENNEIYGNVDGIALFDSHNNLVRNNIIRDNKNGIRANVGSSGNLFENSMIINNHQRGMYLYGGAHNNLALNNTLIGNQVAVYLKDAVDNVVVQSVRADQNKRDVEERGASRGNYVEVAH